MASYLDDLAVLFSDELLQPATSSPALGFRADTSISCPSSPASHTGLKLQEDAEPFTTDDLAVLSDLLGLVAASDAADTSAQSSSTASSPAVAEQSEPRLKSNGVNAVTPKRRARKRPREKNPWTLTSGLPAKSQQQRQKLEIGCLKQQVVELEATIERLQQRKLERERLALTAQQQQQRQLSVSCAPLWEGVTKHQVHAVHELQQENEKLRNQVVTHVEELRKLENVARARHLGEANDKTKRQKLGSHEDAVGSAALTLDAQKS